MDQEKIWDAFQNDESLTGVGFPSRKRFKALAKRVPEGSALLNIGVGNGYLEGLLVEKGVQVSCLDPSESAIEKIREKLGLGERAQVGYSQSMPFSDRSFDYVIMSEVLEHLDDAVIEGTLPEVKRILRKDGRFLGTVPADENLQEGITVCPKCGEQFHRWGHVRSFSQDSLFRMLSAEYVNVRIERVVWSDFAQLNLKGKVLAVFKQLQVLAGLKGSTQNFFFTAHN